MNTNQTKIVVVGGGFAGINLIKKLIRSGKFEVTLVDRNNYNFFPPLLYQVATGFLEVSNIGIPFRKLFQGKPGVHFRLGELERILPAEKKILLSTGEIAYDYLVLANGVESNSFGLENIQRHALPMKTVNDAIDLRNHFFQTAEKAANVSDPEEKKRLTTMAIVGGGPTGVEIAGMIAEMSAGILQKDYPELAGCQGKIFLIDSNPELLSPMASSAKKYTYDSLVKMGVTVRLNARVKDYVNDTLFLSGSEEIGTCTVVWAAGVAGKKTEGLPEPSYGPRNRLYVDRFGRVAGLTQVFAIGDSSINLDDPAYPKGHPQVAQVAIQQAKNLADNLVASEAETGILTPFSYSDKGSMAIIGRTKAVADLPKPGFHFKGKIAWLMWIFVHLFSLIDHRNRVKTFFNWVVAYFTKDQSLRFIIRPSDKKQNISATG